MRTLTAGERQMKTLGAIILLTPIVIPLFLAWSCNLLGW